VLRNTRFISRVEHDISLFSCAHSWDIMSTLEINLVAYIRAPIYYSLFISAHRNNHVCLSAIHKKFREHHAQPSNFYSSFNSSDDIVSSPTKCSVNWSQKWYRSWICPLVDHNTRPMKRQIELRLYIARVYFNVQFYTKCAVLNPFVQFLKHKCAVTKLTKIALIKTVFSFTRYSCGCSRKFQKCCH
jgi:hypothetical protein